MAKQSQSIYQFKITLDGIEPKIWRRIQVPESYTFWDFHVAIQDAMGWRDCHLHQFWVVNPKTNHRDVIGIPMDERWEDEIHTLPGWKKPLSSYFCLSNKRATYEYDFGDSWEHEIFLEKVLPIEPTTKYPRCLAGERSCPPEDCGGVWGYERLLEKIKDPYHEEHKELMEWVGGHFDPENFKPDLVQFDDPRERLKLMMN